MLLPMLASVACSGLFVVTLTTLRCNLKAVSELLLMLCVLLMSRSSSLKPKGIEAEEALLELKEQGALGIPPSSPSSAACNPFATELVLKAFTDMPAVPTGDHTQFAYPAFLLVHGQSMVCSQFTCACRLL